jgi:hypothetical protein
MDLFKMWDHGLALAGFTDLKAKVKSAAEVNPQELIDDELSAKIQVAFDNLEDACKTINLDAVADLVGFSSFQSILPVRLRKAS